MPKEIRYLLFHPDEVEAAILDCIAARGTGAAPELDIRFTQDAEAGIGAVVTGLRDGDGTPTPLRLDAMELRGALVAWCGRAGVPLPRHGMKALELLGQRVALTVTLDGPVGVAAAEAERPCDAAEAMGALA